ncbi:vesicle-fusing ATPase 2 [Drosophila kikkawai]|uniref:Vesicle-fusing ATPase n=1 Tax=Drosophila kikkawai TaxID=30033 RepID=A0A6P4J8A2_DROKI|nr:vesicle-fusing ATPase 2 [Drosophila kikkawai]
MVNITLPDREERLELVGQRIKNLGIYFKISDDVDPVQIAELSKNFTEDELCRLVREAASWAMTRSLERNPDGLKVTQADFLQSLRAIKPRFGVQTERLEEMMPGGFFESVRPAQQAETKLNDRDFKSVNNKVSNFQTLIFLAKHWGSVQASEIRVNGVINRRRLLHVDLVEEAAGSSNGNTIARPMENMCNANDTEMMNILQFEEDKYVAELLMNSQRLFAEHGPVQGQGLICQLIEGPSKSGKSAIAARFAQKSNVPFVKVICPADLLEASVAEKCMYIRKLLEDACVSQDSIVIIDDLERLLEYVPLGRSYSNEVLQTLMVLLKKQPPRGHRLHILCTSSRRDVLEDLGMLSVFTSVIHVPNLFGPDQILSVAEASQRFEREELCAIATAIVDKPISIGIKRLLDLITWVNPLKPGRRVVKFLEKMGSEMGWEKPVD